MRFSLGPFVKGAGESGRGGNCATHSYTLFRLFRVAHMHNVWSGVRILPLSVSPFHSAASTFATIVRE